MPKQSILVFILFILGTGCSEHQPPSMPSKAQASFTGERVIQDSLSIVRELFIGDRQKVWSRFSADLQGMVPLQDFVEFLNKDGVQGPYEIETFSLVDRSASLTTKTQEGKFHSWEIVLSPSGKITRLVYRPKPNSDIPRAY